MHARESAQCMHAQIVPSIGVYIVTSMHATFAQTYNMCRAAEMKKNRWLTSGTLYISLYHKSEKRMRRIE